MRFTTGQRGAANNALKLAVCPLERGAAFSFLSCTVEPGNDNQNAVSEVRRDECAGGQRFGRAQSSSVTDDVQKHPV